MTVTIYLQTKIPYYYRSNTQLSLMQNKTACLIYINILY